MDQAELEFRQAIEFASDSGDDLEGRRTQAEALDGLGHSLLVTGRAEEAELAFRDALAVRDWLAARIPILECFRDLAIAREGLSRTLSEIGRTAEAIEERRIALQIWDILAANHPRNSDYRDHRVNALNDLAWLLATDPDPGLRDPVRALHLAEEAVSGTADQLASWNTLGVARYRAGDWPGAIEALEHSVLSSPDRQGTAFDHFFMAMAWCRLQHEDRAREWLERGIAWVSRHRPGHPALERFREEAGDARQLVRRFGDQAAWRTGSGNGRSGNVTNSTPLVEFTVASRGFQCGQGQHSWRRPTHPLVLATRRHRPVVVFLHPRARDP